MPPPPPYDPKKGPRTVQIGLNLISLLDVNDKQHSFMGNVLIHVFWDAAPYTNPDMPFWRPWIQVHNVKSIEEIHNDGMTQWKYSELETLVRKKEAQNGGPGKAAINVMETRNFVGEFINELNLRSFPFDHQHLRITIMCNTTKDVTFTHKVGRNPETKVATPLRVGGRVVNAIKCNLEADTLSEWDVLIFGGGSLQDDREGQSALAVVSYDFHEHDKMFSAEGAVYQSIIMPSSMLSASSLCVFSLHPESEAGDRFGILFTLILTIVANQFVTQGRLPYLAYFTWLDGVLLSFQLFVYAIVVETAIISSIANSLGVSVEDADLVGLWVSLGIFGSILFGSTASGISLLWKRRSALAKAEIRAEASFDREELRLRKLWFPEEFVEQEGELEVKPQ